MFEALTLRSDWLNLLVQPPELSCNFLIWYLYLLPRFPPYDLFNTSLSLLLYTSCLFVNGLSFICNTPDY